MSRILINIVFCLFIGCSSQPKNEIFEAGENDSFVTEVLEGDETWTPAQSPVTISNDLLVPYGVTLTIEGGVTVSFAVSGGKGGYSERTEIIVRGTLNAAGSAASQVLFTTAATVKKTGLFHGITFDSLTSTGEFTYCTFEYGEIGITSYGQAKLDVSQCTFSNNLTGLYAFRSAFPVSSCAFEENETGFKSSCSVMRLTACSFTQNSKIAYYSFDSIDSLYSSSFLGNRETGIQADASKPFIKGGTVRGGVYGIILRNGSLASVDSVTIDSCDVGIYCHASEAVIANCSVSFSTNKGIGCYGASPVIQACEFDSSGIGIACEQNSSPNISGCTFSGNYGYGIWINDARPEVSGNNFQGNAKQAVKVKQRIQAVSCENNYWGHETGPYHSLNNPQGQGDGVGDFILFTPWAQVPF